MSEPIENYKLVPPALVELITTGRSQRARKLLGAYTGTVAVVGLLLEAQRRRAGRREYTVSVHVSDDLYPELHRWLLDQSQAADHRSLAVESRTSDSFLLHEDNGGPSSVPLSVMLTTGQSTSVRIGGHLIHAEVEQQEGGGSADEDSWRRLMPSEHIVFRAQSREGRDAVLVWLQERSDAHRRGGPRFTVADRWGTMHSSVLTARPLTSVVLPQAQKDRIVADLRWFLDAEAEHVRLGLPWHRGYLFHGPPGTGKTTLARALATHFDLNLTFLPLTALLSEGGDASLLRMLLNCPPRSIVLLEDIDVVQAAHDRDEGGATDSGLSLQGLLNGLDGVATPHGLITICTTNHPERLDPALVRSGRIDVSELLGYMDMAGFEDLLRMFDIGDEPQATWQGHHVTPADLIGAAKPFLADGPTAVAEAIRQKLAKLPPQT